MVLSFLIFKERKRLHKRKLNGILKNMKTLTKGVYMKRNTQANNEKVLRYSLRKYKLGLASVTIGAVFLSFAAVQGVKADEVVSTLDSSTQVEPADSSLTTSGLVTETPTAPVTAENTSVSKENEPVSLPTRSALLSTAFGCRSIQLRFEPGLPFGCPPWLHALRPRPWPPVVCPPDYPFCA